MNTNHHNLINSDSNIKPTFNNNPDSGFINTLRYGMLAVRLLPQSSISSNLFFYLQFFTSDVTNPEFKF